MGVPRGSVLSDRLPAAAPALLRLDAVAGARVTPTSLELPPDLTWEQWTKLHRTLERRGDAIAWWLADALVWGELHFRREYGPALERIYARQSLKNLASISRRVPQERRVEGLSFSHHAEVAALSPDRQKHWLEAAETHSWSVMELRARIAEWRGNGRTAAPALTIRAVADLRELCVQAAERVGLDPAEWAKQALEHAAQKALEQNRARRELEPGSEASLERAALTRAAQLAG